jgi:hypothetical protein
MSFRTSAILTLGVVAETTKQEYITKKIIDFLETKNTSIDWSSILASAISLAYLSKKQASETILSALLKIDYTQQSYQFQNLYFYTNPRINSLALSMIKELGLDNANLSELLGIVASQLPISYVEEQLTSTFNKDKSKQLLVLLIAAAFDKSKMSTLTHNLLVESLKNQKIDNQLVSLSIIQRFLKNGKITESLETEIEEKLINAPLVVQTYAWDTLVLSKKNRGVWHQ